MEKVVTHNVADLPPLDIQFLEGMIGGPLDQGQQVFIMAFTPGKVHDEETRRRAHASLLQTMEEIKAHQDASGISQEEVEAAVEEAIEQNRKRRRG